MVTIGKLPLTVRLEVITANSVIDIGCADIAMPITLTALPADGHADATINVEVNELTAKLTEAADAFQHALNAQP